jgi:hypothetical protein
LSLPCRQVVQFPGTQVATRPTTSSLRDNPAIRNRLPCIEARHATRCLCLVHDSVSASSSLMIPLAPLFSWFDIQGPGNPSPKHTNKKRQSSPNRDCKSGVSRWAPLSVPPVCSWGGTWDGGPTRRLAGSLSSGRLALVGGPGGPARKRPVKGPDPVVVALECHAGGFALAWVGSRVGEVEGGGPASSPLDWCLQSHPSFQGLDSWARGRGRLVKRPGGLVDGLTCRKEEEAIRRIERDRRMDHLRWHADTSQNQAVCWWASGLAF